MLSAVQPSNRLTLGNYLGALRNWAALQDRYDCLFFAVDLHVLTVEHDPKTLAGDTYAAVAAYLAAGVDPERCLLFAQSHVPEHAELAWILTCHSYMGELGRMTQYKDKSARQGANIRAGLFTYPALMAADILLYRTDLVPVGADQRQHVELTRDLAARMNNLYGGDLFVLPEPYIPEAGARIMNLQDPASKMSKTGPHPQGNIYLMDSDKEILKKIKSAVTDSGREISYADEKPGVKNLLNIQSAITGKSPSELVEGYRGKLYGALKAETAEMVVETVRPLRERVSELLADTPSLDRILRRGAQAARERARRTLRAVHERLGFLPGAL